MDLNKLVQKYAGYDGTLELIGGIEVLEDAMREQMFGLENPGFCVNCGAERDGCEPDAVGYPCEECGENAVVGATELAMVLIF